MGNVNALQNKVDELAGLMKTQLGLPYGDVVD